MDKWLSVEFWETVARQTVMWAIQTVPAILVILVLAFFSLRAVGFLLKRLRVVFMQRFEKNTAIDTKEAEKRVDTLLQIVAVSIRTLIWMMIILLEIMGVDDFADSAVIIKARFKTKPIMQWAVGREYRRRLKLAFDEEGIEIPFPHTTVYWGDAIKPLAVTSDK
jgi:hypothetical protein